MSNLVKLANFIEEKYGCSDCLCAGSSDNTVELINNFIVQADSCTGYKKAPVGSPKQRAFCKRHCGMKKKLTTKEVAEDPDSCINKGLRRWKCRCSK